MYELVQLLEPHGEVGGGDFAVFLETPEALELDGCLDFRVGNQLFVCQGFRGMELPVEIRAFDYGFQLDVLPELLGVLQQPVSFQLFGFIDDEVGLQFTGLEQCLVLLFRRVAFASLVRELFDFFPLLLEAGAVDFRIQLAQAPEFLAFLHPQE